MILVPIAYLSLWMYWGMNFSWEAIFGTIVNESFYWEGFFWQYFVLACFALPLSVPDSNEYGLDEGRINIITILLPTIEAPPLVKKKMLVHLTMCVVVYGMFYLLSSLILKEDLPYQPLGLVL